MKYCTNTTDLPEESEILRECLMITYQSIETIFPTGLD